MDQGIFEKLLILEKMDLNLKPQEKRFLDNLIRDGKRNGLHLPKKIQDEVKALINQENDLTLEFSKNLNEENSVLKFKEAELDGLPEDFISSLSKTESGDLEVTLKYPHYFPLMRKAKNPATRQKMEFAFNTRCLKENTKILESLIGIRHKKATLLGFPNHAAFITDELMSKSPETVDKFLNDLKDKLKPLWDKEKELLLQIKKAECEEMGIPFDNELHYYDLPYYLNIVDEKYYSVDQNKLKEYFPLPVVTEGLFKIYQDILGITFKKIENPMAWHPDVELFQVSDTATKEFIGYFYMDMFPREGKYGHFCIKILQPGCLLEDNVRQPEVCVLIGNFTKPTPEKPSLLDHKEVVTYFHEFGHVMHSLCSYVDIADLNMGAIERDFLEAPSQMLENWCWYDTSLKMMASHYNTGSSIPEEMMTSLVNSRLANAGYLNLRQILFALFDQKLHLVDKADTAKTFTELSENILGVCPTKDTNFASGFGHIAGGYSARYYGYLWSEVYAMDMFYTNFKNDILSPEAGMKYRQKILAKGSSQDAMDLLKDFLEREPSQEPFLLSKGLKP